MARLTKDNEARARHTMSLYPQVRSALIPMLHLVQEQDGYLTRDGMVHVAELLDLTPAEVYGTASFYDMFFSHPVGKYLVSVCTNIACLLNGGQRSARTRRGCARRPSRRHDRGRRVHARRGRVHRLLRQRSVPGGELAVLRRRHQRLLRSLVDDLESGRLAESVPSHGTLPEPRAASSEPRQRRRRPTRRHERGAQVVPITDVDKIVTRRIGIPESWTLRSYLENGGYDGLRKALEIGPEQVQAEVDTANLLGRGGAGFEAGKKWSLLRDATRSISSSMATRASRPHSKITCSSRTTRTRSSRARSSLRYAIRASQAFIYVRGEFALGIERMMSAVNEAYEHGALGSEHLRFRVRPRPRDPPGRRGVHLSVRRLRCSKVSRASVGSRGSSPPTSPPYRPLRRSDRRQQRRDDVEHAMDRPQRRRRVRSARRGPHAPVPESSRFPATSTSRATTRSRWSRPPFATSSTTPSPVPASAAARVEGVHPWRRAPHWFGPRATRHAARENKVGERGRLEEGVGIGDRAMDDTTCMVRAVVAPRPVLRPGILRASAPVSGRHSVARQDHAPHRVGGRPDGGSRPAPTDVCDNIAPACNGRRSGRRT